LLPSRRDLTGIIPQAVYATITDSRVKEPELPSRLAKKRVRREMLTKDGKLTLLAVDHTARMVTSIGDDPLRMADRRDLLGRTLRVMACSSFDGLLGSPDVIDELFLLQSKASKRFLDRKVLIGSSNRGGLSGASFELDDRVTGYDAKGMARMRLDGGKFLLRIDPEDDASLKTMEYCAAFVRDCQRFDIPVFLELLPVARKDGRLTVVRDASVLSKLVGVATAIGSSSSRLWLKLPYVEDFAKVAKATTCPILVLGGDTKGTEELFSQILEAMGAGPNVRGVLMGRNILYPQDGDPRGMAFAIDALVRHGAGVSEATRAMERESWKKCELFDE
jgi:DhnA family fructose-bisphosphate aldolase class Ia